MPKITEERRAAQREKILRAAMMCFANKGTHSTTMDDVCREAKLSRGAVYGYFPSKTALVRAIFDQLEEESRVMMARTAGARDPSESLFALAATAMEALARPEGRSMLALDQEIKAEAARDPEIRERLAANFGFSLPVMAGIVTSMQAKGSIPKELDASMVARMFIALQDGLKPQLIADPHFDVRRFLETVRALVLRGH